MTTGKEGRTAFINKRMLSTHPRHARCGTALLAHLTRVASSSTQPKYLALEGITDFQIVPGRFPLNCYDFSDITASKPKQNMCQHVQMILRQNPSDMSASFLWMDKELFQGGSRETRMAPFAAPDAAPCSEFITESRERASELESDALVFPLHSANPGQ